MKPIHVFSHGMGTDSSTLLLMAYKNQNYRKLIFPEGYRHIVIFSDLGCEYPETYELLNSQRNLAISMGFDFVHLKPEMGFQPRFLRSEVHAPSIDDWWMYSGAIGMTSGDKRCTDNWKIQPIWNYISDLSERSLGIEVNKPTNRKAGLWAYAKQAGNFLLTIGFTLEEESRSRRSAKFFSTQGGWRKFVERRYPLIDLCYSREDCNKYWTDHGLAAPRPSNCMYCFYQSKYEVVNLYRYHRNNWLRWVELENNKLSKHSHKAKNYGVYGASKLNEHLEKCLNYYDPTIGKTIGNMTKKELLQKVQVHGGCVNNLM